MTTKRWHAIFAALAFGVPIVAYIRTLTPTVPFWDSGEFIATSWILGLPHPPGNPVYTMLGRIFSLIPIETVAWRVNFMSALSSSLACLFTFLFTVRALRRTIAGGRGTMVEWLGCELGGLVAAFFLAFASSFWDSAIEAEVYSLSSCIIALTIWLGFNWWDHLGEPGNDRLLILIVYILGISTGVHLGTVLVAPGLLVLFMIARPSYFANAKFVVPALFLGLFAAVVFLAGVLEIRIPGILLAAILGMAILYAAINHRFYVKNNLVALWSLAILVGFTVQIFLLIRSQQMPAINEGSPTTIATWLEYLSRKQYGPANPFERRAELWYQIEHMFLRYVGQQWHLIERLGQLGLNSFWVKAVNAIPFLLFFVGAWWNFHRDRKTFWFFFTVHLVMGPGLIFYLNFTDHEVREREYFFMNSYHFMAVWMGMGAAAVYQLLAGALAPSAAPVAARAAPGNGVAADAPAALLPLPESVPTRVGLGLGALVLVGIALLPMRTGWYTHDRSGFYIAHDYAYNMLIPLEPGAVVFTNGDNDTFPLWYIQEVENVRKDVRVVNLSLLNTAWYIRQLRDQEPKVPISFTDKQLEGMGPYQDEKTGKIVWVKDLAVQDIIRTNGWRRPVYLAVTVPDQMGLEKRLTLEALVFRVNPVETAKSLDIERTLFNLYDVFQYKGLLNKNREFDTTVYKDENAYRLVQNYTAAHFQVAYQLQLLGKISQAISVLQDAAKISPDFPGLLEYLGRLYEESGNTAEAEKIYREGVRRFPNAPEFHFHLGVTFYQSGRVEEGIAELRRAAELNQQYFDWFSALFTALWQSGRHAEGVDVLRTWIRAHPEDREGAGYLKQYEESLRVLSGKQEPKPSGDRFPGKG
jgi:hypothetical protein